MSKRKVRQTRVRRGLEWRRMQRRKSLRFRRWAVAIGHPAFLLPAEPIAWLSFLEAQEEAQ